MNMGQAVRVEKPTVVLRCQLVNRSDRLYISAKIIDDEEGEEERRYNKKRNQNRTWSNIPIKDSRQLLTMSATPDENHGFRY